MKTLSPLAMGVIAVGYLLLSGCIVAPPPESRSERREERNERWCANHPHECDHERWCSDHPRDCGRY
jgi:hypothetical protein